MIVNILYKKETYSIQIDEEDYEFFITSKPQLVRQGATKLRVWCNRYKQYFHRLILNCQKGLTIDHLDANPLNNQKINLRICSHRDNTRNSRKKGKNNTSTYKGVCLDSWAVKRKLRKKWIARIKVNYKGINLGRYLTEIEAARAYNEAAVKYFGEFANLNIIKE